jgi:ubiquinone/menaquinone biosynthesis C-methylase UbiE
MSGKQHWQQVYSTKSTDQVGWYAPHLTTSVRWITDLGLDPDDPIIDVGGGASTLVDDLLDKGYRDLSVLDLSARALSAVKERLGTRTSRVSWLLGDVTEIELPASHFELWHDRAVFHFLVEPEQQTKYRDKLLQALKPGGHFIIGVFELEAPPQCSGLPVQRYSVEKLNTIFGTEFNLKQHQKEIHQTPSGVEQKYLYCLFQRTT